MPDESKRRYRFSVPIEDRSVIAWIEKQDNISTSLRMLIGDTIEKTGYIDYSCKPRVQKESMPPSPFLPSFPEPSSEQQLSQIIVDKHDAVSRVSRKDSSASTKRAANKSSVVKETDTVEGSFAVDKGPEKVEEKSFTAAKEVPEKVPVQPKAASNVSTVSNSYVADGVPSDEDIFDMFK